MYQILVLDWESSFLPLLQRVWISVAARSSRSQTLLWGFFFLQTIIAFLPFLFCKCCRPTAYCWIVFSLESQPLWLVSLAFSHHAPPPLAFALVGLNVKVKAGGVGVELPDLHTQSFSPSLAPVLFSFSPQRGQLWFWDPRRAETPPALCSLRMTSALQPPHPPTHAAH